MTTDSEFSIDQTIKMLRMRFTLADVINATVVSNVLIYLVLLNIFQQF